MTYALDTNILIRLLRDEPLVRQRFDAAVERGDEIVIPPLVHYEIRRGFLCKSVPKRENSYRILTEQYPVGEMSMEILEHGAGIYAELYNAKRTVDEWFSRSKNEDEQHTSGIDYLQKRRSYY